MWASFSFLVIQKMPSPVEAFYWFAGAISYTFLHYISLIFIGLLIRGCENKKWIYALAMSALAVIVGGSQYTTVLITVIITTFLIVIENKRLHRYRWIPVVVLYIGFAVTLLAPGNYVRREGTAGMPAFMAIISSFKEAIKYLRYGWSPLAVAVLVFSVPIIWKIIRRTENKYRYRYPGVVFFFLFCIFAAGFTPSLYGVGNSDAGRIQNQIFLLFYIMVFAAVFYGLGWLNEKMRHSKREGFQDLHTIFEILEKYSTRLWIWGEAIVLLVFAGTSDKNAFSSVSALRSLANGEAKTYYTEAQERLTDYKNPDVTVVEVEPFSVKPHVLYFTDIVEEGEPNYWINEDIAAYYGKKKVILRKSQ